jgi:hypothetical protein
VNKALKPTTQKYLHSSKKSLFIANQFSMCASQALESRQNHDIGSVSLNVNKSVSLSEPLSLKK